MLTEYFKHEQGKARCRSRKSFFARLKTIGGILPARYNFRFNLTVYILRLISRVEIMKSRADERLTFPPDYNVENIIIRQPFILILFARDVEQNQDIFTKYGSLCCQISTQQLCYSCNSS